MLKRDELSEAEAMERKNTESPHLHLSHREYQHPVDKFPVTVLVDDFNVPMNVGSVFRLCDALGVEKLYLTGVSPLPSNHKRAHRDARNEFLDECGDGMCNRTV